MYAEELTGHPLLLCNKTLAPLSITRILGEADQAYGFPVFCCLLGSAFSRSSHFLPSLALCKYRCNHLIRSETLIAGPARLAPRESGATRRLWRKTDLARA